MPGFFQSLWSTIRGSAPATPAENAMQFENADESKFDEGIEIGHRAKEATWETEFITGLPRNNQMGTASGITVTRNLAMNTSAYIACVKVISETVSTLPIRVYKWNKDGEEIAENHPVDTFLRGRPSEFMSMQQFLLQLLSDAVAYGNGYARIFRDGFGRISSLQYLENSECVAYHEKWAGHQKLWYSVMGQVCFPYEIIHIKGLSKDGIIGRSPVEMLAEELGLNYQATRALGSFYKSGMRSQVAFTVPDVIKNKEQAIESLKKQRNNQFLVLDGNMEAKVLNVSPKDAEVLSSKEITMKDVARVMRVPLHKIGLMEASTNNNVEQLGIDFVTDTIVPWVTQIEQELNAKLLNSSLEYHVNLNMDFIMRGNIKLRGEYYQARFSTGSITPNEIRKREGESILDNELMDKAFIQSGFVPLDREVIYREMDNNLKKQIPANDGN